MGVDVQPRHPGSNPRGCEFGFLLFIKKTHYGGLPHRFPFKTNMEQRSKYTLIQRYNKIWTKIKAKNESETQ
jgi:hypothetical protein